MRDRAGRHSARCAGDGEAAIRKRGQLRSSGRSEGCCGHKTPARMATIWRLSAGLPYPVPAQRRESYALAWGSELLRLESSSGTCGQTRSRPESSASVRSISRLKSLHAPQITSPSCMQPKQGDRFLADSAYGRNFSVPITGITPSPSSTFKVPVSFPCAQLFHDLAMRLYELRRPAMVPSTTRSRKNLFLRASRVSF